MKYEYRTEYQEYKYGPEEEFANKELAKEHVSKVRNKILTRLALKGFRGDLVEIDETEEKKLIRLKVSIKYPINFFEEQEGN